MDIRIPKYFVPILPAMKKKIVTDEIDAKINIHADGSKIFRRFQVGSSLGGYLENQW